MDSNVCINYSFTGRITTEHTLVFRLLMGDFRNLGIYTVFQKKNGPFVISSYLCFDSYELQENFEKYTGGVACCEYGIDVCESINYSLLRLL